MHLKANEMPFSIGYDVPFAAFDLLSGIVTSWPPLSVVLTDWLSMTPALGLASRPSVSRDTATSAWLMRAYVPSRDHR